MCAIQSTGWPSQSYVGRVLRVLDFLKIECEHNLRNSVLLMQSFVANGRCGLGEYR